MPTSERRYPVLVFDWDGTLLDSAASITTSIQEAAREMGLPVPPRERASHVIGLGLEDALRSAVPELERSGYNEFVGLYRKHFLLREPTMTLFDGVPDMLSDLVARGHTLAVATGKSRQGLNSAMQATQLGKFFTATRCADETESKPHPAMLYELIDELDTPAHQLLMIGDTTHDLEMARRAKVDAVGVSYGAHPADGLHALRPAQVVSSIAALSEWLQNNA